MKPSKVPGSEYLRLVLLSTVGFYGFYEWSYVLQSNLDAARDITTKSCSFCCKRPRSGVKGLAKRRMGSSCLWVAEIFGYPILIHTHLLHAAAIHYAGCSQVVAQKTLPVVCLIHSILWHQVTHCRQFFFFWNRPAIAQILPIPSAFHVRKITQQVPHAMVSAWNNRCLQVEVFQGILACLSSLAGSAVHEWKTACLKIGMGPPTHSLFNICLC